MQLLADSYMSAPYAGNNVFFVYNIDGQLAADMKKNKITAAQIKMSHPLDIKAAASVAKFCKRHKIDVIHCQHPRENMIAILSKLFYRKPRVVYTSHLIVANNLPWRILNRVMTRYNSGIIAVCNPGAALLVKNGYCKSRVLVVHNGVAPPKKKREHVREGGVWAAFSVPKDRFIFSALARLEQVKGLFFLTDAVKHLTAITDMDFSVLIAGDGDLRNELSAYIRAQGVDGRIVLTGHRTDIAAILEGSDAYLNSSASEALSFAILEAMSYGLPVIATNVGGTPDLINKQTKAGLVAEYGDIVGYAHAMKRIMTDDVFRRACGKNGEEAVKNIFSINECIRKTFTVYQKTS